MYIHSATATIHLAADKHLSDCSPSLVCGVWKRCSLVLRLPTGDLTCIVRLVCSRRPIYVSRHRIDSYRQSKPLCREVASEMFVPCVGRNENRPAGCVWHVFRSELMLFVLHMSTLVFGIAKVVTSHIKILLLPPANSICRNLVFSRTTRNQLRRIDYCQRQNVAKESSFGDIVYGV